MKVEVNMQPDDKFYVSGWWATSPEFVLSSLRQQLEAASAVWPELAGVEIEKPRSRSKAAGRAGGMARAGALSPERRSEIASEAANARWGTTDTRSVT